MNRFIPDCYFENIYEITPEFLISMGISAVICDIDNTLVTYDDPKPTPAVREWLDNMAAAGIRFIFLSNNHGPRVTRFAESLGLPFYFDAKKPGTKVLMQALTEQGINPQNAASLGDQIFTDMLTGKRGGLVTLLVPPIKDRTDLFHRMKRIGERPFVKKFFKIHPGREDQYQRWLILTGNHKIRKESKT